jgi:O-antigen/teichoic acid export membrane protein
MGNHLKHSRLMDNIVALGTVQMANYILPLITLPYVTRVLGAEAWGRVAFAQMVLTYFTLVTNWGFPLSATRKVAAMRDSTTTLSEIFMASWMGQWLLAILVISILCILLLFVPFFSRDRFFYIYGLMTIAANVMFPIWFLNGLERIKEVAAIQLATRVLAVPMIFMFIDRPADAPRIIGINAATGMLAGVLSIIWMARNLRLNWRFPKMNTVLMEIKEGASIFVSTIWISLYTTLTPTILGVISGPVALGHYALADRVRTAVQGLLYPVSQALFPRMSHLFASDKPEALRLLKKSGLLIVSISGSISIVLFLLADTIVRVLAGESFIDSVVVLRWLAFLPFVIAISNIFGIQIMIPLHHKKAFNAILVSAGTMSIALIVPMVYWLGTEGAAMTTLAVELFVTILMMAYIQRSNILKASK